MGSRVNRCGGSARLAAMPAFLLLSCTAALACPTRGTFLPEMHLVICPTLPSAQAFSRVAGGAVPAEGCQLSNIRFDAYRLEMGPYPARALTLSPGSAVSIEHHHAGRTHRVPLTLAEHPAWIWYGAIMFPSGELRYGWASLPEHLYHPAFLGIACSGRPP